MKLFQQMLVASAAIGLIAPIGAQANDINIEGMNSYTSSKSSLKKHNLIVKLLQMNLQQSMRKLMV